MTRTCISKIIDVCRKIELYTAGLTFADFEADGKTIDAVVRNIEILRS